MSKHKAGDKFVIELSSVDKTTFGDVLTLNNGRTVCEEFISEFPRYEDAQKEAYNQGMSDAWEIVRKLVESPREGGLSIHDLKEVFGYWAFSYIIDEFSVQEVKAKIEAWEKTKMGIHVGDVVTISDSDKKGLVTKIDEYNHACIVFGDGSIQSWFVKHLTKTGKNIDIQKILGEIGDSDG